MRRRVLPILIAAMAAAAALHGCNGNGNLTGKSNVGATATAFYVAGKAGVASTSPGSIGLASFGSSGTAADPYSLVVADPAGGTTVTTIAQGGTWLPMASVSEWTGIGSGLMSNWAPRFLIFAQMSATNPDAPLYLLDLGKTPGSTLPGLAVRFSSASTVSSSLCTYGAGAGLVLEDWPMPQNSWVTLRVAGSDGSCSSVENQTIAIPLTAGSSTAPMALGLTEPVEAIHASNGSFTGAIELVHIQTSQIGTASPTLQMTDANLKVTGAIGTSQRMQGTGDTTAGSADFQSLGITASGVWLYRDGPNVMAISLGAPATATVLFTLTGTAPLGDVLPSGHALFDPNGTVAYIAVSNSSGASRLMRINAAASPPTATTVVQETTATSIQLAGLTANTGYLVYATGGQTSLIKAVPKTGSNVATPLTVDTLTVSQTVDVVPPVVVGDTVYYTLDDSNSANPARQLFYSNFTSGGASAPITFAAAGSGCAVLVRPFYASPLSTTAAPVVGSVLIAQSTSFCVSSGAALAYANAQLFTRNASGTTVGAGQLPMMAAQLSNPPSNAATAFDNVDFSYFFGSPGTTAFLDGPVQSGMPTFLELDGATSTPIPAIDVEVFTPGAGLGPTRLTQNLR